MRWLVFLLVLLNIGFFGWHSWLPDPLGDNPPPLSSEVAPSLDRLVEVDLEDFIKRTPQPLRMSGAQASESSCFAVGPLAGDYSEGAVMGRVREWLQSRGGRVGLRAGRYHEIRYYWVYLPPAGTSDAAQGQVRKLTANAFGNSVVIPEGNMKNAVSIGVYGLRTALERDLTRLEAKGFEPKVREVHRTGRSLWFTARFPYGYEFPVKRFAVPFEGLEAVDAPCPPPREPSARAEKANVPSVSRSPPGDGRSPNPVVHRPGTPPWGTGTRGRIVGRPA